MNSENKKLPLQLTPEQLKEVEQLGSLHYPMGKVALYLDVSLDDFMVLFNDESSEIRRRYDRGLLLAQADIDKANLKRARDGSLTSIQQFKKDVNLNTIDQLKNKVRYDKERSELDMLQQFINAGEVRGLPKSIEQYYEQMEFIRALHNKWNNRNYIINMVMLKWPEISRSKATSLYCDCLNFFYLDNEVKVDAWANIYAERLEAMAMVAFEMNDFETARRCTMDAAKLRGVGEDKQHQIPKELLDQKPVFYLMSAKQFGIPEVDRRDLADFIDKLDVSEKQRTRLRMDAMVEEVSFELVVDEENQDHP